MLNVLQLLGDFVSQIPYQGFAPGPRTPILDPPARKTRLRPCSWWSGGL